MSSLFTHVLMAILVVSRYFLFIVDLIMYFFFSSSFGCTAWLVGSYVPNCGLNPALAVKAWSPNH